MSLVVHGSFQLVSSSLAGIEVLNWLDKGGPLTVLFLMTMRSDKLTKSPKSLYIIDDRVKRRQLRTGST